MPTATPSRPIGTHVLVGKNLVAGAFKDRHEKIGEGHIGTGAFAGLLHHPATEGVPFILETPGSRTAGDPGISLLKELR